MGGWAILRTMDVSDYLICRQAGGLYPHHPQYSYAVSVAGGAAFDDDG